MAATGRAARAAGLAEKTILGLIAGGAAAVGVVELVLLMTRIVGLVGDERVTLIGVPLAEPLTAAFASPAVVAATSGTVDLTVTGLPGAARAALVAAAVVGSLLSIGIATVLAWLCLRVFIGRPFIRSAAWGIAAVAILVMVVGVLVPLLTAVANAEAAAALDLGELPPLMVGVDLAPIAWGLALAVVAGAFELGQRLQRDSDGLV